MHTDTQQNKKIFDGASDVNGLLHNATPMDVKMHSRMCFSESCIQEPGYELHIKTLNARVTSCPARRAFSNSTIAYPSKGHFQAKGARVSIHLTHSYFMSAG